MRRSVALISAAATTFSLVLIASVVYAYQVMAAPRPTVQTTSSSQSPVALNDPAAAASGAAAPSVVASLAPQDVAAIAAKFLNRSDPYSVELTTYNGVQAYKVTFSSGDIVYVTLTGEVLGVGQAPAPTFAAPKVKKAAGSIGQSGASGGGSSGGEGESEGGSGESE